MSLRGDGSLDINVRRTARIRSLLHSAVTRALHFAYGAYAWVALLVIVLPLCVVLAVLPGLERRRHTARGAARLFLWSIGSPVRVEGSVEGTIRAGKAVVLGKEGEIRGHVFSQDAVIGGKVTGLVVAESRLELQSTSAIDGEIHARAEHLQLDEGARFNGQIQMIDGDGAPPALPPAEGPPANGEEATNGQA